MTMALRVTMGMVSSDNDNEDSDESNTIKKDSDEMLILSTVLQTTENDTKLVLLIKRI